MNFSSELGKMFFRYGKCRKFLYDPDVIKKFCAFLIVIAFLLFTTFNGLLVYKHE